MWCLILFVQFGTFLLQFSQATLKSEVLSNYTRTDLPPEVREGPIKVELSLALYQLIDFDVETQSIHCLFWQRAYWTDSRLAWGAYNRSRAERTFMRFAYEDIWMPDILPYEDIGVYDVWKYKNTIMLRASAAGRIQWLVPAPMKTVCSMQMTDFPYDSHTCEVTITPWQYDNTEVVLECVGKNIDMANFDKSMEWEVTETKCTNLLWKIQDDDYDAIKYIITFRRLRKFYVRLLIWPNVALLTLSSLMFFLPSGTSDRPNFGVTVLLTLTVNLMIITEFVPEASRSFPRVCNYFLGSILLCAIGVLLVCIVDRAGFIAQFADDEIQTGVYYVQEGKFSGSVETKETFKRRMERIWIKALKTIKKNEGFIGFIYFLSTLVAHSSCYIKIT